MRVLYLIQQFIPEAAGETERVTLSLARATQGDGHSAEILKLSAEAAGRARRPGPEGVRSSVVGGVPVHGLGPAGQHAAAQFRRFLDSHPDFDVVHVLHALPLIDAVEVLAARRIPYLMTLPDVLDPATDAARTARLAAVLRNASALVAVSEPVAASLRAEHPDLTVLVVEHGVDLSSFGPPPGAITDDPSQLDAWRASVPLPQRIEEEAFLYGQLYRGAAALRGITSGPALNEV